MKKRKRLKFKSTAIIVEENTARKKLRKAAAKRKERKTPYPIGFEYKKW